MMSSASASNRADGLAEQRAATATVGARARRRCCSTERYSTPALPPSSGWTQSISGQRHDSPYRSRPRPAQELRADGHRVDRRAVVVQQAGHDRLAGAGAAADLVGGFQHGDLHAGLGEGDRGGQAVGPGADDDRGAHARAP